MRLTCSAAKRCDEARTGFNSARFTPGGDLETWRFSMRIENMDRYLYHIISLSITPTQIRRIFHSLDIHVFFFARKLRFFLGLLPDNLKVFFVIIPFRTVLHHFGRL